MDDPVSRRRSSSAAHRREVEVVRLGAFRVVHRGEATELGDRFVVATTWADPERAELLWITRDLLEPSEMRELEIAARRARLIEHSHVLRVLEVCWVDRRLCIVTEHVPGMSIAEIAKLANDPTELARIGIATRVLIDGLSALAHVHCARDLDGRALAAIHGRVTPARVTLGFDGFARMAAFHPSHPRSRAEADLIGDVRGLATAVRDLIGSTGSRVNAWLATMLVEMFDGTAAKRAEDLERLRRMALRDAMAEGRLPHRGEVSQWLEKHFRREREETVVSRPQSPADVDPSAASSDDPDAWYAPTLVRSSQSDPGNTRPEFRSLGNQPNRMHEPGNVSEEREQAVEEEVSREADAQERTERREQDSENKPNHIHRLRTP